MKVYKTDKIILRQKIQENKDVLYLFGDNLLRKGLGGQAKEMRGEENTIGIITKKYPSNKETSFYTDNDFNSWVIEFDRDILKLETALNSGKYKALVIPQLGIGLAKLPEKAPRIYKHLIDTLNQYTSYNKT
jgi:hypothetical protein